MKTDVKITHIHINEYDNELGEYVCVFEYYNPYNGIKGSKTWYSDKPIKINANSIVVV